MLFTMQKKAMRTVMPGYVNYFHKDGQLPTGTKKIWPIARLVTQETLFEK